MFRPRGKALDPDSYAHAYGPLFRTLGTGRCLTIRNRSGLSPLASHCSTESFSWRTMHARPARRVVFAVIRGESPELVNNLPSFEARASVRVSFVSKCAKVAQLTASLAELQSGNLHARGSEGADGRRRMPQGCRPPRRDPRRLQGHRQAIAAQADLVEVVHTLKQVMCIKG